MREDHPIDRLVVAVAGEVPESLVTAMRASARQLVSRRPWILGPPEFFDEPGSRDRRSVGFALSIYTARPPWGHDLDRQVDRDHLEEVKELIREVCRISDEHTATFVVDFAGESIGMVEIGQMDDSLNVGLIGEWERILNEPQE
ncbi:hypothetical protein [Micromonospora zhanjiangensis]|uniref:Uncharacterized protein n=1 Tax=Micromonospora zhanjiangensis TaxID=1522057 RepID=A0ABV8KX52_9ACTN